jgi:hypothetical protein
MRWEIANRDFHTVGTAYFAQVAISEADEKDRQNSDTAILINHIRIIIASMGSIRNVGTKRHIGKHMRWVNI